MCKCKTVRMHNGACTRSCTPVASEIALDTVDPPTCISLPSYSGAIFPTVRYAVASKSSGCSVITATNMFVSASPIRSRLVVVSSAANVAATCSYGTGPKRQQACLCGSYLRSLRNC